MIAAVGGTNEMTGASRVLTSGLEGTADVILQVAAAVDYLASKWDAFTANVDPALLERFKRLAFDLDLGLSKGGSAVDDVKLRIQGAADAAASLNSNLQLTAALQKKAIAAGATDAANSAVQPVSLSDFKAPTPTKSAGRSRHTPQQRYDEDIAQIQARTQAVQAETAALGLNREAQEQVRAAQDLLEQARRDGIAITPDVVRQINAEAAAYAAAEEQYQRTAEAQQRVNDIEENFADLGANSIVGLSDKTKSWNDVLNDTIGLLEDIITQLIKASLFNSAGTGLFQSIAGAFLGAADGMAFAGGGQPQRFASGGIVNRPTMFRFANGTGLMGEAGPEAIVPLVRMANGRLGVETSGQGGGRQKVDVEEDLAEPAVHTGRGDADQQQAWRL
jgi:hypothetical protein